MPNVNYVNPTSIRPEYNYKPSGFLAGMHYSQDRRRYNDVSSLQDAMMANEATKSDNELKDYALDAPVRESKRESDLATNLANRDTIGGIKRNEMVKGNLENDLASGVLKSKISKSVSEAAIKGGEASTKQFELAGEISSILSKAASGGPESLARVMETLRAKGADPKMLQFFGNIRDPKQLKAVATAINEGLLDASEKYQSHMRGIEEQRKSAEKIAARHDATQKEIAEIKQKAKLKDIDQMLQDVLYLTPDKQIGFYDQVLSDPDATLAQKQKAIIAKEAAIKALNLRAPKDDPIIPGLPPSTPRRYGEGLGSQTNTGIPGVTRLP